ncbi:MAG TPA: ribosome-associated translation inhibitor RaiA [Candidatus Paceibacterota bacterium]
MNINVKATNLDLTPALKEYIEEKIGSLSKFLKRWEAEGVVEVWVEVGRTTSHHQKGNVFRAEVDIRLPRKVLRAEDEDFDVRAAIDKIKDRLKREIERYKDSD